MFLASGEISSIRKNLDSILICLGTGKVIKWGINCQFILDQSDKISEFHKSLALSVIGLCKGKSILMFDIRDCQIP